MELLVFRCQTRPSRPSPIAILKQPFQGRRHTARLVEDQAQILEGLRRGKMGAANVPHVRDSRCCLIEDDNLSCGGADGEPHGAHVLTAILHAINQLLQYLRRPREQRHTISIHKGRHQPPRSELQASSRGSRLQMAMQPIEEDAKEGGALEAALTHPRVAWHALHGWLTSCAINLHGQCAAGAEGLDGCKHARADPNGPQTFPKYPKQVVLHSVVCLLEVDKAYIQWQRGIQRRVNEMPQGKKVVDASGGLKPACAGLRRPLASVHLTRRSLRMVVYILYKGSPTLDDSVLSVAMRS